MRGTTVRIVLDEHPALGGALAVPPNPQGLVIFAHGSGSSRASPRNRAVAAVLEQAGFATLLFDLLTEREDRMDPARRFDIPLLAARLVAVTEWTQAREALRGLRVGYFGASTGAAAALVAAARRPNEIVAIVSRGGRLDLAADALERVSAPTLLIVGGQDLEVLALNEAARERLRCPTAIEVIANASHLFEEPGALERVALVSSEWFQAYLPAAGRTVDLRDRPEANDPRP